jgi:hypothetical protein
MSWSNKSKQFQYVSKSDRPVINKALSHANVILKSESALTTPSISDDFDLILKGGCTYLPNFFCETSNLEIFHKLESESKTDNIVKWSAHLNPCIRIDTLIQMVRLA